MLHSRVNVTYISSDAVFLGCVGGVFMLCGFGAALALSRRKDPTFFAKVCHITAIEKFLFDI